MTVTYLIGPHSLVTRSGIAFLTSDEELARRVWTASAGVDDLLVELVRDGLAAVGEFVLVDTADDRVRVLVRGAMTARVRAANGTTRWNGAGVSTWAEHAFDRVDEVLVGDAEQGPDWLPLREGMVRCGGFALGATGRAAAVPAPEPARPGPQLPSIPAPAVVLAPTVVPLAPVPVPPGRSLTLPAPLTEPEPDLDSESESELESEPGSAAPGDVSTPIAAPHQTRDPALTRTENSDDAFDHLFESTIVRSVEDAAIRDAPEENSDNFIRPGAGWMGEPPAQLGDHDGHTITAAELGVLRQQIPSPEPAGPPPADARLEMSNGDVVVLDRDVVIGRRPEVDRVQGCRVPTVVTVPSPRQDVSRTHLRIGWSGRQVLATDLHSMNGTVLIGADGVTRALDGGVPHPLVEGDTLDIGDGITLKLRLTAAPVAI